MRIENVAYFDDIVINLDNVSTIKIFDDKIKFSYTYTTRKLGNTIPDSFFAKNTGNLDFINTEYFKRTFIEYDDNKFLNIGCISSLRYNEEKGVVIFNLNHLHTYNKRVIDPKGKEQVEKVEIPEYVYMKASYDEYTKLIGRV
jgi:hypothetical protein